MPLSEDEQRILQEIERNFYESDPQFARGVSTATLPDRAARNCKLAAGGFVVGLVMLFAFASSLLIGFAGFLVMLGSAFVFERNLRRLGRVGRRSWPRQGSSGRNGANLGDSVSAMRRRLRERFKRER